MKLSSLHESKNQFDITKEFPEIWTAENFQRFQWLAELKDLLNTQINDLPFSVIISKVSDKRILFSNDIFNIYLLFDVMHNNHLTIDIEFRIRLNPKLVISSPGVLSDFKFADDIDVFFDSSDEDTSTESIYRLKNSGLNSVYQAMDQFIDWYFDISANTWPDLKLKGEKDGNFITWTPVTPSFTIHTFRHTTEIKNPK